MVYGETSKERRDREDRLFRQAFAAGMRYGADRVWEDSLKISKLMEQADRIASGQEEVPG